MEQVQHNRAFYTDIVHQLSAEKHTKMQINKLKVKLCKKYKLKKIPTDIDIMLNATPAQFKKIKPLLLTKPIRSISGVIPIAVMSAPFKCPHGKCTFCPGGPSSAFGDVPQSYTGKEPSTMRAIRANYEPYNIVFNRLEQYVVTGHVPEKADVIIQGGTFPAIPITYQKQFVKDIYQALNDFGSLFFDKELNIGMVKNFFELPADINNKERQKRITEKILNIKQQRTSTLEQEQKRNENAKIRCVGLTIETKPDWGFAEHGNKLLELGVTRIEVGIQSVYDEPLRATNRGHTLADSYKSIEELRDLGFKLNFHYMLGLPKTTKKMDIAGLRELFMNTKFRPDMLKIYPCMVMKGTPLYQLWKAGKFQPMTTQTAAEIIADFMGYIPSYCRVMRVQRDIPTTMTEAGVDRTNLRQYVENILIEKKIKTKDIRAREAGAVAVKHPSLLFNKPKLVVKEYSASDGKEFFISMEDAKHNVLFGFVRLRFPHRSLRKEITNKAALVRELHVYGASTGLGTKGTIQHRGLGRKLMAAAEKIAKQYKKNKIIAISAIGTKEYYKKIGYIKEGPYMIKTLQ